MFSDARLVAQVVYLHHGNWQTLQIRAIFSPLLESLLTSTCQMRRKGMGREETWGSSYQGMSIHNKVIAVESLFFLPSEAGPPKPALREENSRATLSCQPALRRA